MERDGNEMRAGAAERAGRCVRSALSLPPICSPAMEPTSASSPATDRLTLSGLTCGHCVRAVQGALASVDGLDVKDVQLDHADVVVTDAARRDDILADARRAVEAEGYTVA